MLNNQLVPKYSEPKGENTEKLVDSCIQWYINSLLSKAGIEHTLDA